MVLGLYTRLLIPYLDFILYLMYLKAFFKGPEIDLIYKPLPPRWTTKITDKYREWLLHIMPDLWIQRSCVFN